MKLKRILAAVLSLCVVAAMAGCGDKTDSGKKPGDLSSADVDAATFEGLTFKTNPDLDFGGKTVTVARNTAPKEGVSALYDRELAIKAAMEEKYNVKIEYIEYGSKGALENLVLSHMSGKAYADIVFNTSPALLKALTNEGIFRSLDDYIDFSNDRFKLTDTATKYVDGKHYSYYPIKNDAGYFIYYNTDLLISNNCEDPRELYEAGKWNWEAFEKIAKACTGTKNGKTIYGLAGSNLLDGLMASNGLTILSADPDKGTVTCNLYTDAGKNALNFLRQLTYVDKAVDGTYGGHNGIETFKNGFAAMIVGPQYYGYHFVSTGIPFEIVPLPIGDDTDVYTNICQYCYCYSLSTNSEYSTEDLLQLAFELERNDPSIEGGYREDTYEANFQAFVDQYVDQENHYIDDDQAKFVYDFINDKDTVNKVEWLTDDLKSVIAVNIYSPISKGEDVRSHLTSVEPVIKAAIDEQF